MRRLDRIRIASFLAALALAATSPAATRTWTGGGGDSNWTTAANWGGVAPAANDDLVFPAGAAQTANNNDFASGTAFNSITIGVSGTEAGGYTLNGNAVSLAAGLSAYCNGTNTIGLAGITLTADQNFISAYDSFGNSKRLAISAPIDLQSHTLTLDVNGILDLIGVVSGSGGIGTTGSGVIFVQGTDTFTGATNLNGPSFVLAGAALSPSSVVTVSGGLLQFANGASAGTVTMNSGGTLELGGGSTQHGSATSLTMNAGSTFNPDFYSLTNYGQLTVSGAVTLNSPTLVAGWAAYTSSAGNTFTIIDHTGAGAISGTFNTLAEGSAFNSNGRRYTISYVAGDGNDVVMADAPLAPATVTATPASSLGALTALFLLLVAVAWRSRKTATCEY